MEYSNHCYDPFEPKQLASHERQQFERTIESLAAALKEKDELIKELEAKAQALDKLEEMLEVEQALTTLPDQAKEPLRDRDMLDWWEKRGAVNVCKSGGTYWTIEIWEGTFDAPTFREAVAAAMKSDQEGGEPKE